RGMNRPASIISQADTFCGASGTARRIHVLLLSRTVSFMAISFRKTNHLICSIANRRSPDRPIAASDRFHLNLPPLGCRHAGAVGVAAHEVASRRPVRNKNHSLRHLAFDTLERDFPVF